MTTFLETPWLADAVASVLLAASTELDDEEEEEEAVCTPQTAQIYHGRARISDGQHSCACRLRNQESASNIPLTTAIVQLENWTFTWQGEEIVLVTDKVKAVLGGFDMDLIGEPMPVVQAIPVRQVVQDVGVPLRNLLRLYNNRHNPASLRLYSVDGSKVEYTMVNAEQQQELIGSVLAAYQQTCEEGGEGAENEHASDMSEEKEEQEEKEDTDQVEEEEEDSEPVALPISQLLGDDDDDEGDERQSPPASENAVQSPPPAKRQRQSWLSQSLSPLFGGKSTPATESTPQQRNSQQTSSSSSGQRGSVRTTQSQQTWASQDVPQETSPPTSQQQQQDDDDDDDDDDPATFFARSPPSSSIPSTSLFEKWFGGKSK